ncbi:hypothetical protein [Methanolobus psychrotolerans]|uniref:hypothetical protein n=1 Tax=Methanolobus psychrotolerans TaxID=1874706 RepID=UPI00101ADE88|nr:hypothetical protein [Methanolobus psychrotolerans]
MCLYTPLFNPLNNFNGQVITLSEIRNAIIYWKFSAPGPGTGHALSLSEYIYENLLEVQRAHMK